MGVSTKKIYTPDDLLKMSDGKSYELDDGKLVRRPMGTESSWIGLNLSYRMKSFCKCHHSGHVLPSDASYQCFPDAPTRVRKPDVSFIKRGRLPGERLPKGHTTIAPNLAVEVLSPRDLSSRTNKKIQEYLQAGVELVWVIDPETRTARVHRKDGSITELHENDELTGEDVLPGFRCRLSEILPRSIDRRMQPAFVADVGNSRIKWGRCLDGQVIETVSLPPDDDQAWQAQWEVWKIAGDAFWAVAGVHPLRRTRLAEWLQNRGQRIQVLDSWQQLPIRILIERPERVGIDRLLNAVAASRRVPRGEGAVLVDAGSAITVDWLDESGAFAGGAIFPGIRLMTRSLHDYTALLPLVHVTHPIPPLPATSTEQAMEAGVYWAAAGGIQILSTRLAARSSSAARVFVTGGDGPLLATALNPPIDLWPNMTLEGIRIAVETMP